MTHKFINKLFAGLLLSLSLLTPLSALADVVINEQNFPDENFRAYLLKQDYGEDGVITDDEIAQITEIYVSYKRISTLEGIQYFTALTYLSCGGNQLTALDVSKNTALTTLLCSSNQLTELDVTQNTALTELWCYSNQLTTLDVSQNTALTDLHCASNQLTSLDVSGCEVLARLDIENNPLEELNLSGCKALTSLSFTEGTLKSLDMSGCTALTSLQCNSNQLTSLDVSTCTALITLYCYNNQISGENMDKLIESLPNSSGVIRMYYGASDKEGNDDCTDEQVRIMRGKGWTPYYYSESGIWEPYFGDEEGLRINEQNFPDAKFRKYLLARDYGKDGVITDDEIAGITSIDVSKNSYTADEDKISTLEGIQYFTALTYLDCYNNQLTALNVSQNTALTTLYCEDNQLTALDVSGCPALTELRCYNNRIYGEEMDKLIESLPNKSGIIDIYRSTSNTEGNIFTWNQADAIKAKGWEIYNNTTKYDGLTEWPIKMHEGQGEYWATLYAPFGYTLPEGAEAYIGTVNTNGTALDMTSIGQKVPRGVPVVIKGNSASVVAEVDDDITAEVGDNDLVGMYEPFDATGTGYYTLGIYEDIVGFYKYKGTVGRFKAVLELPEGIAANGYRMVFEDDDITAIEDASVIVDNANAVYYDLQGRRVAEPQKGQLYIVNGKTVLYQP